MHFELAIADYDYFLLQLVLPTDLPEHTIPIPEQLHRRNKMVGVYCLGSTEDDLKVGAFLIKQLKEEGVKIETLVKVVEILKDKQGWVQGVKYRRYDYAAEGQNEKWQLVEVEADYISLADTVIIAAGHRASPYLSLLLPSIKLKGDGTIETKENSCLTSQKNIFACGAVKNGPGSVTEAMASGKKAAEEITTYLRKV